MWWWTALASRGVGTRRGEQLRSALRAVCSSCLMEGEISAEIGATLGEVAPETR